MNLANKPINPITNDVQVVNFGNDNYALDGMTLLEHYAGLAMQGLLSSELPEDQETPEEIAIFAVKHAKALIQELEKEQ